MKIMKIATYWTTEQAENIYMLLDELKTAIWQSYGEDIVEMHREIASEQEKETENDACDEFDDELPF